MLYLATASTEQVRDAMRDGLIGQMLNPKAGNVLVDGATFALDNGCVKLDGGRPVTDPEWNAERWRTLLKRHVGDSACLFATVPDVVSDAAATDDRWHRWADTVRELGYRAAYVLQNGCGDVPADADAVFTGGDTAFKLGGHARRLMRSAKARGLWCHMGRVNSLRRLRYAAQEGYDSVDGTFLAFGPDRNLPQLLSWVSPDPAAPPAPGRPAGGRRMKPSGVLVRRHGDTLPAGQGVCIQ